MLSENISAKFQQFFNEHIFIHLSIVNYFDYFLHEQKHLFAQLQRNLAYFICDVLSFLEKDFDVCLVRCYFVYQFLCDLSLGVALVAFLEVDQRKQQYLWMLFADVDDDVLH
jgi:hypothetical protein